MPSEEEFCNEVAKQELSYDPWGRLRNPATQQVYAVGSEPTLFLGRGYTGHEHLTAFGLINMNARLYDPAVGRFLSPDPYVQMPDFTQNFNRYSYCLNNPLIYTDPDGEIVWWIIYGVFFTEPGYEIQKYLLPFAFKVDFNFGTNENKLGFDISYGEPKIFPYATRENYGKTYYWKHISSDYKGWETREGKETSYFWLYHEGETKYLAGKFSQTVGFRKFGIPSILGLDIYNDCWGDKGDRFRTSMVKINLGGIGFENTLFTGDPGLKGNQRYINNEIGPQGTYYYNPLDPYATDPNAYRVGVLAIRFGPFSIGLESEKIRAFFQEWIHDITGDPYFEDLSENPNYPQYHKWRFYFQFGW